MPKKRTNITIEPRVFEMAAEIMAADGFGDFSSFLEQLIRDEWKRRKPGAKTYSPDDPQGRYILNEQPTDRDSSVRKALKEVANALEDLDSLGAGKPKPPEN